MPGRGRSTVIHSSKGFNIGSIHVTTVTVTVVVLLILLLLLVKKLDRVGRVQKRLGSVLRDLKQGYRGQKLSDGKQLVAPHD